MKKTLALLLCAASILALLAGCGSKSTDDKAPAANGGETASTEKADYPTSPITVIIPYSPGGGSDILTRKIMEYIELPNNQKLVAVNASPALCRRSTPRMTAIPSWLTTPWMLFPTL